MFGRFVDEIMSILFMVFLLRTALFIMVITMLERIIRNCRKIKPLPWHECYSGKYQDLIKNNKILDGCTICALTFNEFTSNTQTVALKCKHAFTDDPLMHKWINVHRSCPTCRGNV